MQPNTASGVLKRSLFSPLGLCDKFTPYVLRGMAASWMIAYGVPVQVVKQRGNWSSDEAFNKHYRVELPPRINLRDVQHVDPPTWRILAAHKIHQHIFHDASVDM
mgnify:CR=1 FL=1